MLELLVSLFRRPRTVDQALSGLTRSLGHLRAVTAAERAGHERAVAAAAEHTRIAEAHRAEAERAARVHDRIADLIEG